MQQAYLDAIKSFEGFTPKATWDYAQHSNGFGTKALYPGEAIDAAEADRRFSAEIAIARGIVEKHAAGWDEGTKAALTSLTFNAGTRWISSGLGDAVRNGDIAGVREKFVQYAKAGGEVLPGLVKRRLAELDWIGSGIEGTQGAAVATASPAPMAATASASPADLPPATSLLLPTSAPRDAYSPAATSRDGIVYPDASDPIAPRGPQLQSMLLTLLFDLQTRGAASATGEGRADGREQSL